MTRAHLYRPIQDNLGNLRVGAIVRVLDPATLQAIVEPMYTSDAGLDVLPNPFTANAGVVDIYLDRPRRVLLGIRVGNEAEFFATLDVALPVDIPPPHDHPEYTTDAEVAAIVQGIEKFQPRATVTFSTPSLTADQVYEDVFALHAGYRLLHITVNVAARIRLYTNPTRRTQDSLRAVGTAPLPNNGLVLEFISAPSVLDADLTPQVDGSVIDSNLGPTNVPYSITNMSGTSGPITVTFLYIRTE